MNDKSPVVAKDVIRGGATDPGPKGGYPVEGELAQPMGDDSQGGGGGTDPGPKGPSYPVEGE